MQRYKVIQWATGVVGRAALKGILQHPRLELVGLRVYSAEKEGQDAGELIDRPPCGVKATRDSDEIATPSSVRRSGSNGAVATGLGSGSSGSLRSRKNTGRSSTSG